MGQRKIEIFIYDKKENKLLHDEIILDCASLEREISWDKFDSLTIKLYERGNQFANNEYNKKLIKEGQRHLITLNYSWNGNKFTKQ